MLKKDYIVKKKIEFNDIIKTGKVFKNKMFVIYYKDNNLEHDRFGITVGTKLGNAVFRNKYKRKVRAVVFEYMKNNQKKQDYIILLRKGATLVSFEELQNSFNKLMMGKEK